MRIPLLAFLCPLVSFAQSDCSELFISEYVEGQSNNKAIELYNPSQNPVNLGNYRLIKWTNGSVTSDQDPEDILQLPSNINIAPQSTYSIALNLTDPNGTGQNVPIDTALQYSVDTLLCPGCVAGTGLSRTLCFNGDDALSLEKTSDSGTTWIQVDIFACIGERPSNSSGTYSPTAGWTILPPYSSMPTNYPNPGSYFLEYWTQNKTLKRKYWVEKGVSTNPAPQTFNASVEWDSLPNNTFTGLGHHDCECNLVSTLGEEPSVSISIFPNPASREVFIASSDLTAMVRLIDVGGRIVLQHNFLTPANKHSLDLSNVSKGIYTLEIISTQRNFIHFRILKKLLIN